MMSGQAMTAFAHAYTFMDVVGDAVTSWLLLWRATTASDLLARGTRKKDEKFLEGQIKSAQHFIYNFLPITMGKVETIMTGSGAAVEIDDESFGGK
jgi:hypothetical protein